MKTLKNHTILYDAECPMCSLYTGAFQQTKMLGENGRFPYQEMPETLCPLLNQQRAVNEIALVNTTTGEVLYGVESLFAILGNAWPVFKPLFRFKPFAWLMAKAYAFISYNRRVIIPPPLHAAAYPYQPSFRLRYRIAYLLVSCFITALILSHYTPLLYPLLPAGNFYREYAICLGQLLVQGLLVALHAGKQLWTYLGNMMTVSLAGALALLPMLLTASLTHINPVTAAVYFAVVVALMFAEHYRRTRLLQLNWLPTLTWVLYRVLVLYFLLA
ncbi:DCC1-like thiol-disulfide oxidoreductase family protein [Deminuibacter soli]|uniref:DUF393 domain-containing protein n=1 Tax=Deminuibacter soli TaxID=2291815 RepID=A0A3E1NQ92_9BACT|nr:DCC1-like thiol-disulfide oxidoreductase family protein [Deminuibacter soli]RFM30095.1 DUF393 domain-containing protein [Deminuibacter soli]